MILYHFMPKIFQGGSYGVLLFFVLSGYLITSLLLREYDHNGALDLRAFYVRRALRLLPALVVLLFVVIVLAFFLGPSLGISLSGTLIGAGIALAYVFNWVSFVGLHIPHSMTPLWTLSVEEQFYLLWPILVVFILKSQKLEKWMFGIVLVSAAGFAALGVAGFAVLGITSYYRTWTWVSSLLLGAVVAVVRHRGQGDGLPPLRRLSSLAWGILLAALFLPAYQDTMVAYAVTIPVLGVAAALVINSSESGYATRFLSAKALVYLGQRSYALYLWNLLLLEVCQKLFQDPIIIVGSAFVGTFIAAEVSYRAVELPALRLKVNFERVTSVRSEKLGSSNGRTS